MRFYTLVVSMVVHVALVVLLLVVPLYALGALPGIRVVPEFIAVTPAKVPEPPPPPSVTRNPQPSTDVAPDAAPTSAPDRIEPEAPSVVRGVPVAGPPGVDGGLPGAEPLPAPPSLPPPPAKRVPLRQGGDIRPPQKTRHVAPIYPSIARENRVQGVVILEAVIDETGRVTNVRVLRSIPLLDQAATQAVRQWQFAPTLLNGEPVPIVMTVTVSFELK
jgi:protein TonB